MADARKFVRGKETVKKENDRAPQKITAFTEVYI